MADKKLSNQTNGSRLSRLLIDKGTDVLKRTFDLKYPPSTLASDLNANKSRLNKLRYKVITKPQWKLLYPSFGSPDSKNFDITLLTVLLREICGLASPAKGWNSMPPPTDTSIAAKILRIKFYRNEVYSHVTSTEVDDVQFDRLWREISIALVALGVTPSEIDEMKEAPVSSEEDTYIERLKEWKKSEDDVKELLEGMGEMIKDMHGHLSTDRHLSTDERSDYLLHQLAHCNFQGNIESLAKSFFPGTREWLLCEVDDWFRSATSRVMILTAGPGVGKSVFAAKICELYKKKGKLAASHFCQCGYSDYRNPRTMLQSVASQMCQSVAGFKTKLLEQLQRPHSRQTISDDFRVLLNDPLHSLKPRKPMMIVIDALDESEAGGKNELLDVIANEFPKLPEWVKVFVTSRPELPVKKKLAHLKPLEITARKEDNERDLFNYLKNCLSDKFKDDRIFEVLVEKCQGSFLYAYYVQLELRDITRRSFTIENINSFLPKGISSFYEKQFGALQMYLDDLSSTRYDFKQFLAIIAAAEGPLPLVFLPECLGLPEDANFHLRKGINDIMSAFLPVYEDCLTVYHKSLVDWLKSDGYEEHPYTVAVEEGNEWLWQKCKILSQEIKTNFPVEKLSPAMQYALDNGAYHLLALGEQHIHRSDYEWLVDFVIVCVRLSVTSFPQFDWLVERAKMDLKLQTKFLWHIMVFGCINSSAAAHLWYCQNVVNSYPFDVFTQEEIELAKSVLRTHKYVWCENLNISKETENPVLAAHSLPSAEVSSISVSTNKELLAVAFRGGLVTVFELPSLQMLCSFDCGEDVSLDCVTFTPDNLRILCGRLDYCLDIETGKRSCFFRNVTDGNNEIVSCSFSPNGTRLVTCSDTSEVVKLWDVNKQIPLTSLHAEAPVNRCAFSKCGLFIVGKHSSEMEIGEEGGFAIWNSITLERIDHRENLIGNSGLLRSNGVITAKFPQPQGTSSEIVLSENGYYIEIFQLPQALLVARFSRFQQSDNPFTLRTPTAIKYQSWDCVMDSSHNTLKIIDPLRLTVVAERRFLPFNRLVSNNIPPVFAGEFVIAVRDDALFVFKTPIRQPSLPTWPSLKVTCCSFSPDGSLLASCSSDDCLRIWNVKTFDMVQSFQIPAGETKGCWWSEESLWIVNVTHERTSLWKFRIDGAQKLESSLSREIPLRLEPTELLSFSESVLVLKCVDDSVLATKIADDEVQPRQILSSDKSVECASVGEDSCILTASLYEFVLWEQNREDVFHWSRSLVRPLSTVSFAHWEPSGYHEFACSIDSNRKFAYFVLVGEHESSLAGPTRFCECAIVNLHSSTNPNLRKVELRISRKRFPTIDQRLGIQLFATNHFLMMRLFDGDSILVVDPRQGRYVANWRALGFHSSRLLSAGTTRLTFTSRHDLLAIPEESGNFQFVKLHFDKNKAENYDDNDDIWMSGGLYCLSDIEYDLSS